MNRLDKFLLKLDKETREVLLHTIRLVKGNNLVALDVKKMKGSSDFYRVRVGKYRIIFRKINGANVVVDVTRRSDITYNNLFM